MIIYVGKLIFFLLFLCNIHFLRHLVVKIVHVYAIYMYIRNKSGCHTILRDPFNLRALRWIAIVDIAMLTTLIQYRVYIVYPFPYVGIIDILDIGMSTIFTRCRDFDVNIVFVWTYVSIVDIVDIVMHFDITIVISEWWDKNSMLNFISLVASFEEKN